jgi:hypothetical protein
VMVRWAGVCYEYPGPFMQRVLHHQNRTDDMWHHLVVTWERESGDTQLYFDGRRQSAFWVRLSAVV